MFLLLYFDVVKRFWKSTYVMALPDVAHAARKARVALGNAPLVSKEIFKF
jgi:hypothetical protein